jgi:ribosome-binding protein aMBF1 (putative translation factor)
MEDNVDIGLSIALRHARRGQEMSHTQLAAFCNCAPATIARIEQQALLKMRLHDSIRELGRDYKSRTR